jgi:hypothetical protein
MCSRMLVKMSERRKLSGSVHAHNLAVVITTVSRSDKCRKLFSAYLEFMPRHVLPVVVFVCRGIRPVSLVACVFGAYARTKLL